MTWNSEFALSILPALLSGFETTLLLTLFGILLALILGFLVAIVRYLEIPIASPLFSFYTSFFRGTPLLVQAYFIYFGLPHIGITLPAFQAGVLALGIYYSPYIAEVVRAGINDLPLGQWDATKALSMSLRRTWTKIMLPQVAIKTLPMLGNYLILMFKDSAVLSAITIIEMLTVATDIGTRTFRYLEPLTLAGIIFLVISIVASFAIRFADAKLSNLIK